MWETWIWSLDREGPPGEGNGNSPLYSCLDNPMDRGAWQESQRVRHDWATNHTHAYNMECCKSMESQRVWHDWAAKHTVITWLCFIFGTGGVNSYVTVLWWRKAWSSLWCWCHQASILSKDTLDSLTHAPADRAVPGSAAAWLWRLYYTRASLQRHFLNIQEFYLMMRTSDIFSGELS